MAVYYMVQAWEHMAKISHRAQGYRITRRDVLALGAITEPTRNKHGFRQSAVFFRDSNQTALPHTLIPGTLQQLLDAQTDIDPQDFYAEFESIHPFLDGNGRVGTILANYLNGTFQAPVEFHYQSNWRLTPN